MSKMKSLLPLYIFNTVYLVVGGVYFLQDLNHEFVIYVAVIVGLLLVLFGTLRYTEFPLWLLWLFSVWGLLHVLGGAVETRDGVLFAYRIYPFLDFGGDFFILKYDQVVHFYLYGIMALIFRHLLCHTLKVSGSTTFVIFISLVASLGFSALNEIMEFIIAVSLERNGVGGYENAMLDLIFNLAGAVVAVALYYLFQTRKDVERET